MVRLRCLERKRKWLFFYEQSLLSYTVITQQHKLIEVKLTIDQNDNDSIVQHVYLNMNYHQYQNHI